MAVVKFLLLLLALAANAHAAFIEPGPAALAFLEKVRAGQVDLEPGGDTAISPQTLAGKKEEISRRLARVSVDLGTDPLELSAVRVEDGFAAVQVRKSGVIDPSRLRVFSVAMVKRGETWLAAPLPASFENTGSSYAVNVRRRLENLENWMLREQVLGLQKLRADSASQLRGVIEASLTEKQLRSMGPEQVADAFLSACQRRDLPAILGFLGGLGRELPADWGSRMKAAQESVIPGTQSEQLWRCLASADVLRTVVLREAEGNTALTCLAYLDPMLVRKQPIRLLYLEMTRDLSGLWRVDPAPRLLGQKDEYPDEAADDDSELLNQFPAKWLAEHPVGPLATAELAQQAFVAALKGGDFLSLLKLSELGGETEAAFKAYLRAAELWWSTRDQSSVRHLVPLAVQVEETWAVGVFQQFTARDPGQFDPQAFHFKKSEVGWLWTPVPDVEAREKTQAFIAAETAKAEKKWQSQLLADSVQLERIPATAPSKADSQKVAEAWLAAMVLGDVNAALGQTAHLSREKSKSSLLQNLGYEILSARRSRAPAVVTGIYHGDFWAAVGVKSESEPGKASHPFFPILQTPQGARLLGEADLFAAGNRGRDFLNKTTFERLGEFCSAESLAELKGLFESFQKDVAATAVK